MSEMFVYSTTPKEPPKPLVTVITASTGNPLLRDCIKSVQAQTYDRIQHLLFIDGQDCFAPVYNIIDNGPEGSIDSANLDVIPLPYSVGKDRWNGHRMYGAGTHLADGQFLMFLDDDNSIEPDHIKNMLEVINRGNQWAFAFRNIQDSTGFLCQDNCESLGKWSSIINDKDFFIDVNCYFLPKDIAMAMSPVWNRKFREPGQMEIDRAMYHVLVEMLKTKFDTSYKYTVNYTVGNSPLSVKKEFFLEGNEKMLAKHKGELPWRK